MLLECSFCFSRCCSSWGCNQLNYSVFHSACVQSHLTLFRPHGLYPARFLCPRNLPCKNTGVGCCFLLQRFFPTQGLNLSFLCLMHWQEDFLPLCHLGSLNFLAMSHGMWDLNSQTRDWAGTACTGSAVLTTGPLGKSPNYGIAPLIRVRCGTVVRVCVCVCVCVCVLL